MPFPHAASIARRTAALLLAALPAPAADLIDPAALGFGSPAFTLDTTFQDSLSLENGAGDINLFEVRALIPALKWQHDSWLFAAGLNYTGIEADFNTSANLGTTHLHDLAIQLVAAYNNPNTPWWALGFLTPGIASDFSSVTSDSLTATSLALVGYRWNDQLDLAAGVFASWSLGEATVLPAIGFIWNPSSHWTIQATPPIVAIGWKPIPNWTFGLVAYPAGGTWEIGNSSDPTRQINLSLWRAALSIERRLGPHWRISARSGLAFAGDIEFRDSSARVLSSSDLDPAPFAALALKWAF
jgi:hypothetical protein